MSDQHHRAGGIEIEFTAEQRFHQIIGELTADELRTMVFLYMANNCIQPDKEYMASCAWYMFSTTYPHTDRGVYYTEELYDIKEQFRQELN